MRLTTRDSTGVAEAMVAREPFSTHGALNGGPTSYPPSQGRLSSEEYARLREAPVDYVVYSYGTPIAWHYTFGGWYMAHQKFSVTTSKHQGTVRRALASMGVDA